MSRFKIFSFVLHCRWPDWLPRAMEVYKTNALRNWSKRKGERGWAWAFGNVVDKKHMTHPLPTAQKWQTHPYTKVRNYMTHPLVYIKTWIFGFLLIIQLTLVLCMTKFLDTLLQPIPKSQKSYLSLKRQMWKTEPFLSRWTLWVLTQTYRKTRVLKLSLKHLKISIDNLFVHITCRKCSD